MYEYNAADVEMLALVLVTASAFAATNLDNMLILVGLLGAAGERRPVLLGAFMAASISILLVALAGASLGNVLSPEHVGYLGIIPLAMGSWFLYRELWPGAGRNAGEGTAGAGAQGGESAVFAGLSTYLLMVANSGDSLALFVPLFAESSRHYQALEAVIYLVMVVAWALLARLAVARPAVAAAMQRHGRYLVPLIMLSVGAYILMDTASDTLL